MRIARLQGSCPEELAAHQMFSSFRGPPGDEFRQYGLLQRLEGMDVAEEGGFIGGHRLNGPVMQAVNRLGLQFLHEQIDGGESLPAGQRQEAGFDQITLVLLQHNRRLVED